MKSGKYVTEIVTRLYQSRRMKALYPCDAERLNHIFAEQVYGCAPTEIIYQICLRYILGFSDEIHIEKTISAFVILWSMQKTERWIFRTRDSRFNRWRLFWKNGTKAKARIKTRKPIEKTPGA